MSEFNPVIIEFMKIGLCIGGGGAKGLAAVSIVEGLLNKGIQFSAISGTSMGAIVGTYLALRGEVTSLKKDVLNKNAFEWIKMLDPNITQRNALIKGKKFYKEYSRMFDDKTFYDLQTPLYVTATNLHEGKLEYMNKGKLVDAAMASSAYPGVFPPHKINGVPYSDGGIMDNLPYEILFEKGMDKVIVINLFSRIQKRDSDFSKMRSVIARSLNLLMANALEADLTKAENIFVFHPHIEGPLVVTSFKLSKLKDNFEAGSKEFKEKEKSLDDWLNA